VNNLQRALFLLVALACSCHSISPRSQSETLPSRNDSTEVLRKELVGTWGNLKPEEAFWRFTMDSLTYLGRHTSYPYALKHDSLWVKFPKRDTATLFGTIAVMHDTFRMVDASYLHLVIKAYRLPGK
jgi:hypothetical protein